jgi:hypothetical protein
LGNLFKSELDDEEEQDKERENEGFFKELFTFCLIKNKACAWTCK